MGGSDDHTAHLRGVDHLVSAQPGQLTGFVVALIQGGRTLGAIGAEQLHAGVWAWGENLVKVDETGRGRRISGRPAEEQLASSNGSVRTLRYAHLLRRCSTSEVTTKRTSV